MSSWEKVVRNATKPKSSPPKAKYIDPLVAASNTQDGTLLDIFRALQIRLRDPNSVVVFKSLIVVHTLVRAGDKENVLGYLSGSKILGLEAVVSGHDTAQNLNKYAVYLDRRVRTYGAIKYDIIRDKAERRGERDGIKGCNRLRALTVDKGLLREVTLLQKEMDTLAECKFYLDDMDDDVVMTALRLLVKDLLLLFQAVNEGVINVLEHYFEMSHHDATTALKIYKRFCTQTEKVVAYLSVAKKMQNIINVPIPNLKHAPVSLAKSLEEYLLDPNFEKNREEYRESKRVADGRPQDTQDKKPATPAVPAEPNGKAPTPEPSRPVENRDFLDFFSSIEQEQQPMFPQAGSPVQSFYPPPNPFLTQQFTGMPGQYGMQTMPLARQITGFAPGGLQPNPFMAPQSSFSAPNPFLQQQSTGFGGMQSQFGVQQPLMMGPQATGANPFRQSLMSASNSMPMFPGNTMGMLPQPTGSPFQPAHQQSFSMVNSLPPGPTPYSQSPGPSVSAPFTSETRSSTLPPLGSSTTSSFAAPRTLTSSPGPLTVQQTGSRNPFAPPPGVQPKPPPAPTGPSLNQLAYNAYQNAQQPPPQNPPDSVPFSSAATSSFDALSATTPSRQMSMPTGGLMSNVASAFNLGGDGTSSLTNARTLSTSSASPMPMQQSQSNGSASPALQTAPLRSQTTGYGGSLVKPFKPTSSFGTSLADSLPPIPEPMQMQSTGTPNPFRSSTLPPGFSMSGQSTGATSFTGANSFGQLSTGQTNFTGGFGNGFAPQPGPATGSLI